MKKNYEKYWQDLKPSHNLHPGNVYRYKLIRKLAEQLTLPPCTIIDCGCGDGSLLSVLRDRFPSATLFGMDVSQTALKRAARSGTEVFRADLGKPLPRDLPQFDLVVCSEVIEHVPDDSAVLDNLQLLCAPGGSLILTTQSGRIYNTEIFLGHLRHYRLTDLVRQLESRSFTVTRAFQSGWPWLRLQKVVAHHLQPLVKAYVIEPTEPSSLTKAAFITLSRVYMSSSQRHGPQLIILATKNPSHTLPPNA